MSECLTAESFFLTEFNRDDELVLRFLCSALARRAARFVAVNLAGVAIHRGLGKRPSGPALVIAEGSTFWRFAGMASWVRSCLSEIAYDQKGPYLEIISVDRANLFGSAAAALLNT